MSKNEHTGDAIRSKILSKQGEENWERIFGKKDVLCKVCGLDPKNKLHGF